MHILLIHQAFAALDEAGGTRHYELACRLVEHGHRVTIITSPVSYLSGKSRSVKNHWREEERPQPGIIILRAYTYRALHKSFVHRVFSFLSFMFSSFFIGLGVKNVDLVWGTSPPLFQGVTAWLLARMKRAPFLFEIRDLWPAFAIAVGVLKNRTLIALSEWLEKFLYHRADQMIVNSPGYIDHVRQRGGRNVQLIPNGADPDMFSPDADGLAMRKEWGLEGKFIILYAGAHGISNDLEVVIRAAASLQNHPDIRFVFVGDGKEKGNLQSYAAQNEVNNITWVAPVPKNQMSDVLAAADACIAILKPIEMYKTTYPNKVFDYMAAGRPVLLVIDGVIREVVDAAKSGIFIPPGDAEALARASLYLAEHPGEAHQMGKNGRNFISEHFNRARLAEDLVCLLEDLRRKHA